MNNSNISKESIAGRILNLIQERHLSVRQFAMASGVSPAAVAQWKAGNSFPSIENLYKIACFFHVTTDYLISGKEPTKMEIQIQELQSQNQAERELLENFRAVSADRQKMISYYAEGLVR